MKNVWLEVPTPCHRIVLAAPPPPLQQRMVRLSPPFADLVPNPRSISPSKFPPAVWRLIKRAFAVPDRSSLIESVFSSKDGSNMVRDLRGDDAQSFIDVIDEVPSTLACSEQLIGTDADTLLTRLCWMHPIFHR